MSVCLARLKRQYLLVHLNPRSRGDRRWALRCRFRCLIKLGGFFSRSSRHISTDIGRPSFSAGLVRFRIN